jgi:glycosyltransferase involved in cell wall biosynthesis
MPLAFQIPIDMTKQKIYNSILEPIPITEKHWDEETIPFVSISCVTYNHTHYIANAIESFLMQKTTFPVEILIHDDTSTDGTAEIIREYQKKHPDLIFPIYQTENQFSKGKKISLTYQFPRARGKYIALCEGDDFWIDPLKLQKQAEFLEANPDCTLCFHAAKILDETKGRFTNISRPMGVKQIYTIHDLLMPDAGNFIKLASVVLRAGVVDKYPDWIMKHTVGDYPLYLLYAHHGNFGYLDQVMSVYRISTTGIWSTKYKEPNYAERHVLSTVWMFGEFNKYTNYIYDKLIRIKITRRWYRFINTYTSEEIRKVGKTLYWKYRKHLRLKQQVNIFLKLYFPVLYQLR